MKLITYSLLPLICIIFFLNFNNTKQETQIIEDEKITDKIPQAGELIFGDKKLTYFIEGEGIPIFVCADAGLESKCISQNLKNQFQFVFIEPRVFNYYEEPRDFSHITMDTIVSDLEVLRKKLGFEKVYVLGHSIVGLMAWEYARKYPKNSKGVIMIGTPPYFGKEIWGVINSYWKKNASKERKKIFQSNQKVLNEINRDSVPSEIWNYNMYKARVPKDWYDPLYDVSDIYAPWRMSEEGAVYFVKMMYGFDITNSQIKTPTFLSIGNFDFTLPPIVWSDHEGKFKNITMHKFEKSGHFPHVEEQELFDKLLLDWIQNTDL